LKHDPLLGKVRNNLDLRLDELDIGHVVVMQIGVGVGNWKKNSTTREVGGKTNVSITAKTY
jgi:hypothetical protein